MEKRQSTHDVALENKAVFEDKERGSSGMRDCSRRLAPYAPGPGGEDDSSDRVPRGTAAASAPQHYIMYRIA